MSAYTATLERLHDSGYSRFDDLPEQTQIELVGEYGVHLSGDDQHALFHDCGRDNLLMHTRVCCYASAYMMSRSPANKAECAEFMARTLAQIAMRNAQPLIDKDFERLGPCPGQISEREELVLADNRQRAAAVNG